MTVSLSMADLFSGTGGLSLGFSEPGLTSKFALDFDWGAIHNFTLYTSRVRWLCKDIRKERSIHCVLILMFKGSWF